MHSHSTKQLIQHLSEIKRLPHLPEALLQLNRLLSSDQNPHVDQVSKIILQDPLLTSGLLKSVNSAKYHVGKPIETIAEAVTRMGVNDLRVIALALHYQQGFVSPPKTLNQQAFLDYSLLAAKIAAEVAGSIKGAVSVNEAFMLGLMHEIGVYLLLQCETLDYQRVVHLCEHRVSALVNSENQLLGFSHANLGARLVKEWGFPAQVVMGVLGHHAPHLIAVEFQQAASIGLLAESGALFLTGFNGLFEAEKSKLNSATRRVLARVGLAEAVFIELVEKVGRAELVI